MEDKSIARYLLSIDRIKDEDGSFRYKSLAVESKVSKSRISVVVDALEKDGYVKRNGAREIILTEKGKERIETLYRELRELGDLLQAKLGLNEEGASELALIIATECDPSIKHSLLG